MTDIKALDYNTLQNLIVEVMGTGTGDYGYGQTTLSSEVLQGNIITEQQWDNLKFDIINAKLHQDGVLPNIVEVTAGEVIGESSSDAKINYANLIDNIRNNRFDLSPAQSTVSTLGVKTYLSTWSSSAILDLTMTFANANDARYFFNSGGKISFTSERTGGSSTLQNNAWTNLLTTAGTIIFSQTTNEIGFYDLTDSFQTILVETSSAPYADNKIQLEAKCDVADNTLGTATAVDLKLSLLDLYVDPDVISGFSESENPPGDLVDGTLTITVEETKASGTLRPAGTGPFSITSPSYTISNIVAS